MDISFRGCMWRDGMFLVKKVKCDSVVGVCPDTKTIVGAQGIRGSILEQADLWWYGGGGELVGGKFCGIYEEGEGLPKKFEGGQDKRLGGEWAAIYSFLRLLLCWSDVLCVSGDVIFSTLKSMLHARRIGVKRVEKATGEYFSNLSRSTRLSQVILNLFERQEDRRGGCKKQGEGWMAKLVKRWTLLFLSVQRWGKECRKHFHIIIILTPGEREGEVALLSWTWSWSAQSTSLKNIS